MAGCYIPIPVVCDDCGKAPSIGENGNWFIGDQDTGIAAQGPAGETGSKGDAGEPGPGTEALEEQVEKIKSNLIGKNNLIADFNNAREFGKTYYGNNNTLNKPTKELFYYAWIVGYDDNLLTQFATVTNSLTDKIWYRKYVNGTWSDWDYFATKSELNKTNISTVQYNAE